MADSLPGDHGARDRIANDFERTLFVEAGAGTGKTTALVSRIVGLVRNGVPLWQIAAITFTDKAAAELNERARQELEHAARRDTGYESLSEAERERCEAALPEFERAAIQTLHSFAQRILGLYPLEAMLPPQFKVLDDIESQIAFGERWREFMDQLLEDAELRRPLLRALTMGLRLKDLQPIGMAFHRNWERLKEVGLPQADEPDPADVPFPAALAEARRLLGPNPTSSALAEVARLRSWAEKLEQAVGRINAATGAGEREMAEVDLLRLAAAVPKPNGGVGKKGVFKDLGSVHEEWIAQARRAYLCALLPRIREFALEYAAERREAGLLGYQDLLALAVELLRTNGDARGALHNRYQRILIDEFQDTDPLQVELAALLASAPDSPAVHWTESHPQGGRLFFVGDPRQSIYRFRRADIELYQRAAGAFDSASVPLTTNFRSTRAILEWVNSVFSGLFAPGGDPGVAQAAWAALEPRPEAEQGAPVLLIGGEAPGANAREVREREADGIADAVLAAQRENWLGGEAGTRFGQMGILLPARTNSPAIERALARRQVPFRVESRSLLFATQDVRDLTNVLAAIDDPTDEVAVVAALRTPGLGCRDGDLLNHRQAGGRWNYLAEMPAGSAERVRGAMEALRELHERRWQLSPGALIEEVVASRHLLEIALAGTRPRESWRRLRFVAEQARELDAGAILVTLRQFIEWLRLQAAEGARVNEGVAVEPDDDAVRIMTIHAAKGLEFEVVFLAGLGAGQSTSSAESIWPGRSESGGVVELRTGPEYARFGSAGYVEAAAREKSHDRLQRTRLLYVGATRARRRLVVSLWRAEAKTKTHDERHSAGSCTAAECIEAAAAQAEAAGLCERFAPAPGEAVAASAAPRRDDSSALRNGWRVSRAGLLRRTGRAPVIAATAIAHGGKTTEEKAPPDDEEQPWRKGRAGTSIGRAVHAVLQTVKLEGGEGLEDAASSQAVAEGVPAEAARIAKLSRNALQSRPVQEAIAAGRGRYWREVYVGTRIEGVTVEGFIDLLYEGADGLVVVDYKTDSARSEADIDRALERYRLQGAAYAVAVEHALGRPVEAVWFVFTEPQIERAVEELDRWKQAVKELIPRIAAGEMVEATPPGA